MFLFFQDLDGFHFIELQMKLMEGQIQALHKSIRPGCKRLNWNSLGIQEYIAKNEEVQYVISACILHCHRCVVNN